VTAPALTPPEHEHSAAIEEAARWLAENRASLDRPIVPTLKECFGLSALDAVRAAAEAVRYEVRQ
jgi:hypothetical protein